MKNKIVEKISIRDLSSVGGEIGTITAGKIDASKITTYQPDYIEAFKTKTIFSLTSE